MIKHIKDILMEDKAPDILIPRRTEGRFDKMIQQYIRNGNKGDLNLSGMNLTKFPDVLKYVNVGGDFYCSGNQLKSLEGAPKSVDGDFWCNRNQLTSLTGAPVSVGGNFYCNGNRLTSLEGAPKSVGKGFYCSGNQLKSLVGAPVSVGGNFYCSGNQLKSLVGAPVSVGNFYCNNNPVKFTKEQVRAICDVKGDISL